MAKPVVVPTQSNLPSEVKVFRKKKMRTEQKLASRPRAFHMGHSYQACLNLYDVVGLACKEADPCCTSPPPA